MKLDKRKIFGLLMAVLMTINLLPTVTFAETTVPINSFVFNGKTYYLTNGATTYDGSDYVKILSGSSSDTYNFGIKITVTGDRPEGGKYVTIDRFPSSNESSLTPIQNLGVTQFADFSDYLIPETYEWKSQGGCPIDSSSGTAVDLYMKGSVCLPYESDFTSTGVSSGRMKYIFKPSKWGLYYMKNGSATTNGLTWTEENGNKVLKTSNNAQTLHWYYVTYVNKDFFKENKIAIETMGDNVKTYLAENFTTNDLSDIYSADEMSVLGIRKSYVFEFTSAATISENMTIGYRITNNTANIADGCLVLATAFNDIGEIVGGNRAFHYLSANGGYADTTITVISTEVPSYVKLFVLASCGDATPLAECITIGDEPTTASVIPDGVADISYTLNSDETVALFTVGGTLQDGKLANAVAIVTKPERTLMELLGDGVELKDVVLNVQQYVTNENGEYVNSFSVNTDVLEYNNYTLSVYYGKAGFVTDSVLYTDSYFGDAVVADFNSMTLAEFVGNYKHLLLLDETLMNSIDIDEQAVAKAAVVASGVSASNIVQKINREMAAQLIKKATTEEEIIFAIENYNKYLEIVFEGWLDVLGENTSQRANVFKSLADIETLTDSKELITTYEKSVILEQINNISNYREIQTILTQPLYSERVIEYGLNLNRFTEFDEKFPKELAKSLEIGPYSSWEDFKKKFSDYTPKSEVSGKPNNNSSSGGVSSGKGSSSGVLIYTTNNEVQNQTNEVVNVFSDITEVEWAASYINELFKLGYINGKGGRNFCPNDKITREEVVKILVLALGLEITSNDNVNDNVFVDAESDAWYTPYLIAAYKAEITQGVGNDRFGVGDNITREELATMICRASKAQPSSSNIKYADDSDLSEWAKDSIYTLSNAGIINGNGANRFEPKTDATRAEAAKMIYLAVVGK